jgi:hypothetical protein
MPKTKGKESTLVIMRILFNLNSLAIIFTPPDSDRNNKKSTKSIEEMLAHNDSDGERKTLKNNGILLKKIFNTDEDLLGFSDEKPVYQNPESLLNPPNFLNESDDCDLNQEDQENDDHPAEEAQNADLAISSDEEEHGDTGFDWVRET